jgi:hypothetical protein
MYAWIHYTKEILCYLKIKSDIVSVRCDLAPHYMVS